MTAKARYEGAEAYRPDTDDLHQLAEAAAQCHGCDLYENATQTVFGRGTKSAALMLVGEQPGDVEDVAGEPFVGPAGRLLDEALAEAGAGDVDAFVTNAVKHFRWKRGSGKRRIHEKPTAAQASACRPWLEAELQAVRPTVLVALGATAAGSLFGPSFRLTQHRGEVLRWPPESGPFRCDPTEIEAAIATLHPSAVLRAQPEDREAYYRGLVDDLRLAASLLP